MRAKRTASYEDRRSHLHKSARVSSRLTRGKKYDCEQSILVRINCVMFTIDIMLVGYVAVRKFGWGGGGGLSKPDAKFVTFLPVISPITKLHTPEKSTHATHNPPLCVNDGLIFKRRYGI